MRAPVILLLRHAPAPGNLEGRYLGSTDEDLSPEGEALARRCAGGPPAAREELVGYHNDLYRGYCQAFGSAPNAVGRMKELWFYLAGLFEGGEAALKALRRVDSPAGYESWAARVLEGLPLRSESAGDWLEEKFPAGAW